MYVTMMANVLIAMFISLTPAPNVFEKIDGKVMCDEVEVELIEYSRISNFSMEDVKAIVGRCRRRFVPTK